MFEIKLGIQSDNGATVYLRREKVFQVSLEIKTKLNFKFQGSRSFHGYCVLFYEEIIPYVYMIFIE